MKPIVQEKLGDGFRENTKTSQLLSISKLIVKY